VTEPSDRQNELVALRAAIEAQSRLRGILPDDQLAQPLDSLREKEAAILANVQGSGGVAQGAGAVAGGAGSLVAGRDLNLSVHQATPTDRTDPSALRQSSLMRLMEQVGVLTLTGIDPAAGGEAEARLSLDAVYTALRTLSPIESVRADQIRIGERWAMRLSALEQLNLHPRLVLLGDPGSGKSTFVHFVALCHAGQGIGHAQVPDLCLSQPGVAAR